MLLETAPDTGIVGLVQTLTLLRALLIGSGREPAWRRNPSGASTNSLQLECAAHLAANKGEPTEEPIRFAHLRSATFQELLDEVARRLNHSVGNREPRVGLRPLVELNRDGLIACRIPSDELMYG